MFDKRAEAGIAIGPILFVIAILAILATAIAAGSGSFSSDTQRESDDTAAGVLIGYGHEMQVAVGRVVSQGTPWMNISFGTAGAPIQRMDGSAASNITANPNCSASTCRIFDVGGAGMLYKHFISFGVDPAVQQANGITANNPYGAYPLFYMVNVAGVGTPGLNSLMMRIPYVRPGICNAINAKLGNATMVLTGAGITYAATGAGVCSGCDNASYALAAAPTGNRLMFTTGNSWQCSFHVLLYVR